MQAVQDHYELDTLCLWQPTIQGRERMEVVAFLTNRSLVRIQHGLGRAHYLRMSTAAMSIQDLLSGDLTVCSATTSHPEDNVSVPSSAMLPRPWKVGDTNVSFMTEHSPSLVLSTLNSECICVLPGHTAKGSFFGQGWEKHKLMGINMSIKKAVRHSQEIGDTSQDTAVGSPLQLQLQHVYLTCGAGLKHN